jgi:hypothetical protein
MFYNKKIFFILALLLIIILFFYLYKKYENFEDDLVKKGTTWKLNKSCPYEVSKTIVDIMNDPKMKSIYPWLGTGDARDAQFRVQITALKKSLRAGGGEEQAGQEQQQAPGPYLNKPPYGSQPQTAPQAAGQQGQPVYNNSQQQQQQQPQQLKNHNDLLYKAYVDTVQTTNVTLENLKNYREQIITKINNLSPMYPNINAQQAITALDNRIRKYSAQAA